MRIAAAFVLLAGTIWGGGGDPPDLIVVNAKVTTLDGARAEHSVGLTWYVTDRDAYLKAGLALGVAYRQVMGKHFPAMSAVEVKSLMEPDALVEIEATAVLP